MNVIGNIFWIIFGGLITAIMYFIAGLLLCITIIGIPFGIQLFKFGNYALWPFGREIVNGANSTGCLSVVMNVIWICCGWWEIALTHLFFGLVFCITIIGIPLGIKHFQMALLSCLPFGKEIRQTV